MKFPIKDFFSKCDQIRSSDWESDFKSYKTAPQNVSENIAVLKNTNDGSTGGRVLFHKTLRIFSEQLLCEMLPKLFAKRPWVKLHNI